MSSKFRSLTFKKIAAGAGISVANITIKRAAVNKKAGPLTDFVKTQLLKPSEFKNVLSKLKLGDERDTLIYNEVVKRKPFTKLVAVKVPGPIKGSWITYKVMPRMLQIDGTTITLSAETAQKIANHFDMIIPPPKMSKQIYDAAPTKIRPSPLSTAGVNLDGKSYTAQQVVDNLISDPRAAIAYSDKINKELEGKDSEFVAGEMKSIYAPSEEGSDKLHAGGWRGADGKPLQSLTKTFHPSTGYSEYSTGLRLAANKGVVVEMPDGQIYNTTMTKLMEHPQFYKSVSDTQGIKRYKT